MLKKVAIALGTSGIAGTIIYNRRRQWLAKRLKLPTPPQYQVSVERNIPITMRDGAVLPADHYFPKTQGDYPTILVRSVYGRGYDIGFPVGWVFSEMWTVFAERGYHVLVQTTRGRLDSGGTFEPLVDSRNDGQTTIEWIGKQSWFNGSLGMWGQSALGYVQFAAAPDAPDYLKAIMPGIITSSGYNLVYPGGAFAFDTMLRWSQLVTRVNRKNQRASWEIVNRISPKKQIEILQNAFKHLPVGSADEPASGQAVHYYRKWVNQPRRSDPYWQEVDHSPRLPQIKAKPHFITGWYDFVLGGMLKDYHALVEAGNPPYMTIGAWSHYSPEVIWTSLREGIAWNNAHLKGDQSLLRPKPVRLFIMGANEWRDFDNFPPPSQPHNFYLQAGGNLNQAEPKGLYGITRYTYDPSDPTPVWGGALLNRDGGARDNRPLEARADVVCFTSETLPADLEIIGYVRSVLFVDSDREYTDFYACLCDVLPDGQSINVCDGLFRLEPGKGEKQADGTLKIEVDLWATAYSFKKGHRLRLQVSGGAHPRWNRNLGTGEPLATATKMLTQNQTVYHDSTHPSALILPEVRGQGSEVR
jgi:uncharacterized protein